MAAHELRAKVKAVEGQAVAVNADVQRQRDALVHAEGQLRATLAEKTQLEERRQRLTEECKRHEGAVRQLQEQFKRSSEQARQLDADVHRWQQLSATSEDRRAKSARVLAELHQRVEAAREAERQAHEQARASSQRLAELEGQCARVAAAMAEYRAQCQRLEADLQRLQREADRAAYEARERQVEIARRTTRVAAESQPSTAADSMDVFSDGASFW